MWSLYNFRHLHKLTYTYAWITQVDGKKLPPGPGGFSLYYVPWSRAVCKRFHDEMRPSHLVVKSLTHGSWSGNIVNRQPPRGGGFLSINVDYAQWHITYTWITHSDTTHTREHVAHLITHHTQWHTTYTSHTVTHHTQWYITQSMTHHIQQHITPVCKGSNFFFFWYHINGMCVWTTHHTHMSHIRMLLMWERPHAHITHTHTHISHTHITHTYHTHTHTHTSLTHTHTQISHISHTCTIHTYELRITHMYYGVATISRLLKMIGLFCKRAL